MLRFVAMLNRPRRTADHIKPFYNQANVETSISPELSPAPEVSLSEEDVLDLAWDVVLFLAQGPRSLEHMKMKLYQISGGQLRPKRAQQRLAEWMKTDKPLACIRQGRPPRPRPRFHPDEVHDFLAAMTSDDRDRTEQGWRLCVQAGMDPKEAWGALYSWRFRDRTLPTGQWFSEDDIAPLLKQHDDSDHVILPGGVPLSLTVVETIRDTALRGRKIAAIKDLRNRTGLGLRDSKTIVEQLMDGLLLGPIARTGTLPPVGGMNKKKRTKARKRLDECIDALLRDRPLHWVILTGTKIVEDATVQTMAVGLTGHAQPVLFFNPRFTLRISRDQCKGVLLHEVNHLLFGHVNGQPVEALDNQYAWLVACEVTANEFIPYPLPGHPITLERLDLPPMESTLERYRKLCDRDDLPAFKCVGPILSRALSADPQSHTDCSHDQLHYPAGLLLDAAELVAGEVDRLTAQSVLKHAGIHAGKVSQFLEPEGLPQLPWNEFLKKLAKGLRIRVSTLRYPSRRQPERIGIVPGRRSQREDPVVLAAVDTSGSMSLDELSQVADELVGLLQNRVRVAYLQCDTDIVMQTWLRGKDAPRKAHGRGGTDLRPPFSQNILDRYKPDLLVYFTDGYGPAPKNPPPGLQVLWVLTGTQPNIPARYGKVVCMRPRHRRERVTQGTTQKP